MAADTHPTTTATATATATSTIPSDPTINTQPAPPAPEKAPQTPSTGSLPQTLRLSLHRRLLHLLRATDYNLLRLTKLLSTPTDTDTLLCTLSYTLELLHAISSHILDHRLTTLATTLASKTNDVLLLPGETLIASLPAPPSTKAIAHIVGTIKALAAVIADFRIFVRLWGLVGIYTWARSTYLAGPLAADASAKEKLVRRITWAQIVSCVLFQFYENGAYLSSKGALTHASWAGDPGKARETWWWIVSSRWWAAHVFLELVRLMVLWRYEGKDNNKEGAKEEEDQVLNDGEKEAKLLVQQRKRANELWWRDLVSNLAYAPLTLHWSVHEGSGFLSNWGIGLCGMIAGGSLLVDAWRQTA